MNLIRLTRLNDLTRTSAVLVSVLFVAGVTACASAQCTLPLTIDISGLTVAYPGQSSLTSTSQLGAPAHRYTFAIEGVFDNPVLKEPVLLSEIFPAEDLVGEILVAPGQTSFVVTGSEYTYYRIIDHVWYFATLEIGAAVDATGSLVFTADGSTQHPTLFPDATFTTGSITLTEECYPDCDLSGALTILDYICFGDSFAAEGVYADCDSSSSLNILDFICFGDSFAGGCP